MAISKVFEAFVIGPMAQDDDSSIVNYGKNISNITDALETIALDIKREHNVVLRVTAPEKRFSYHDISEFALGNIDICDLAVADISERSPSVMYELSMLHSLGTPTLIVDRSPIKMDEAIFYLNGTMIHGVKNFSVEELFEQLADPVKTILGIKRPLAGVDYTANKITQFYRGMPLVDVRAITGIATSYYYNFLRHVLSYRGPLNTDDTVKKVIIVVPDILRDNFGALVQEKFDTRLGDKIAEIKFENVFARTQRAKKFKDAIVDYATPIDSLVKSQQFERVSQRLTSIESEGDGTQALIRYQKQMIKTFCQVVTRLCQSPSTEAILVPEFMSVEHFLMYAEGRT